MRFYAKQHNYYCGIDLHARTMYVCVLDSTGQVVLHKNMKANPKALAKAIKPFQDDLCIAVECMFAWYWVADFCEDNNIPFVLGHALYMKAIHGGKAKNDKIDSYKIASLLRGGTFPMAYVYPRPMRSTRVGVIRGFLPRRRIGNAEGRPLIVDKRCQLCHRIYR